MGECTGGMSAKHREILEKNGHWIIENLRVDKILPKMNTIFDQHDRDLIKSEKTDTNKATKLLELLPKHGIHAYPCFVKALTEIKGQEWLAKRLEQMESQTQCDTRDQTTTGVQESDARLLECATTLDVTTITEYLQTMNVFDGINVLEIQKCETRPEKIIMLLDTLQRKSSFRSDAVLEAESGYHPPGDQSGRLGGAQPGTSTNNAENNLEPEIQKNPQRVEIEKCNKNATLSANRNINTCSASLQEWRGDCPGSSNTQNVGDENVRKATIDFKSISCQFMKISNVKDLTEDLVERSVLDTGTAAKILESPTREDSMKIFIDSLKKSDPEACQALKIYMKEQHLQLAITKDSSDGEL